MLFNSYEFILVFLPITLAGFLYLHHQHHVRTAFAWLVLCSLFFYGWWNPKYLLLIIGSITINYLTGSLILGARKQRRVMQAKILLWFGVLFNLSLLGYRCRCCKRSKTLMTLTQFIINFTELITEYPDNK